jgi:hypothetical protein
MQAGIGPRFSEGSPDVKEYQHKMVKAMKLKKSSDEMTYGPIYKMTGQTRMRVTPDDYSIEDEDIRVPLNGRPGAAAKQGAGAPYSPSNPRERVMMHGRRRKEP